MNPNSVPQGPPRLTKPLLLTSVGLLLTVVYTVVFLGMMTATTGPTEATRTTLSPTPQTVKLTVDEWGIYSDDPNISCSVTASDGSTVPLQRTKQRTYVKPEQFYSFEISVEGSYQVSCTSPLQADLNLSAVDGDYMRSLRMFQFLPISMIVGAACLIPGGIWMIRVVRKRKEYKAARTALLANGGDVASLAWGMSAVSPSLIRGGSFGGVPPALSSPLGYGEVASAGPAASAHTASGLPLPGAGSQTGANQFDSAQSSPYGIAPKQVIYRAVPAQDDDL
ncbi:hypothetical protein [Actinomyces trachealis]|uniref:hypothetical protein n=1 Tax=Actinomyces trachealis TaxID=2763540 RepID=UPI0018C76224|nr:hypothetical protein [Actinomyces trachealis]